MLQFAMDIADLLNPVLPQTPLAPRPVTPPPPPPGQICTGKKELWRDQRVQIRTLIGIGWTQQRVATHLSRTPYQVYYTMTHRLTPQKVKCGPKPTLDTRQIQGIIAWISQSKETRRMP